MRLLPRLFQPDALAELLRIRAGLEACPDPAVRDLLFLCWLNILESCSNVFKEGNGLKYRNKKRRPGKYQTVPDHVWIPRYFGPSIRTFVRGCWRRQCRLVSSDLAQMPRNHRSRVDVLHRSCLEPTLSASVEKCDAAVFSPPYANRFDYFESFKIELWMGNFVESRDDLRALRQQSMRNNLAVQTGAVDGRDDVETLLGLMDETSSSVRMGIRKTLRGYFSDMARLAASLRSILGPSGQLACVVGNSAYAGVLFPTDLLCALIFRDAGFTVQSVEIVRPLHVSSQQRGGLRSGLTSYMRESIITCRH